MTYNTTSSYTQETPRYAIRIVYTVKLSGIVYRGEYRKCEDLRRARNNIDLSLSTHHFYISTCIIIEIIPYRITYYCSPDAVVLLYYS